MSMCIYMSMSTYTEREAVLYRKRANIYVCMVVLNRGESGRQVCSLRLLFVVKSSSNRRGRPVSRERWGPGNQVERVQTVFTPRYLFKRKNGAHRRPP